MDNSPPISETFELKDEHSDDEDGNAIQEIQANPSINDQSTSLIQVEANKYFDSTDGNLAYMLNNERRISSA